MSLINLEEVSGTIIVHNRPFSAKEILQAIIREAVPVEFRDGTLAIGIERIYPQPIPSSRNPPSSQREECPLLVREIARIKREIMQINKALQLNNGELEQRRTLKEMELGQYLNPEVSGLRNAYRNQERKQFSVPPTPFPERESENPFDLFRDPEDGTLRDGFLKAQTKCKKCGHILPETAKFCNACGSPTPGVSIDQKILRDRENSTSRTENSRRRF